MDKFLKRKRDENEINNAISQRAESSTNLNLNNYHEKKQKTKSYLFQSSWENDYFVIDNCDSTGVICLLCNANLTGYRRSNCERHYRTYHKGFQEVFPKCSDVRKVKLQEEKKKFKEQKNILNRFINTDNKELATEVSFLLSNILAKNLMPFTHGEIMKTCVVSSVEILARALPEKHRDAIISASKNIPMSNDTVVNRVHKMADEIFNELLAKFESCAFYSLALDESTDVAGISQLMIFARLIQPDGSVLETFLTILPLNEHTTGKDVYDTLLTYFTKHKINLNKLASVITDGAPSMVGKNKGLIGYLNKDDRIPNFVHYHCLIHIEALCSKMKDQKEIMSCLEVIVKVINFLTSKSLNKRLLRRFLEDVQAPYSELIVHAEVRWLSRGKALSRFLEVFEEVKAFLVERKKDNLFPEIFADDFIIILSFMVDIFGHLNDLNLKLQGRDKFVFALHEEIVAFKKKLQLFETHILKGNLNHFPILKKCLEETSEEECPSYVKNTIKNLSEQFQQRFEYMKDNVPKYELTLRYMDYEVSNLMQIFNENEVSAAELELIDMQSSLALKYLHQHESVSKFWSSSDCKKFPLLRREAFKVLSMFGTTYTCESAFSLMNHMKNKKRSRLLTTNLEGNLRLALYKGEIIFKDLASSIQSQGSH